MFVRENGSVRVCVSDVSEWVDERGERACVSSEETNESGRIKYPSCQSVAASFRPISRPAAGQSTQNTRDRDHTGYFCALGPLWKNVIHIIYEDFAGSGKMQSSVATKSCHHREGMSSQTYGIDKRSGVSRLLFRPIISKFQSDNLTGEIQFCLTFNCSITGQRKPWH